MRLDFGLKCAKVGCINGRSQWPSRIQPQVGNWCLAKPSEGYAKIERQLQELEWLAFRLRDGGRRLKSLRNRGLGIGVWG